MKITIESADNGLVKTIVDKNSDGNEKLYEKKKVYQIKNSISDTKIFVNDLIRDLGLFTGNVHEKKTIRFSEVYGEKYDLTDAEVMHERKQLANKSNELKKKLINK